ncbi:NAD-dependent epimerase/dehydratase family protein [Paraburkholderia unamae]|uniref:NAD-dependent epimerase/dehydratase family protein n=1 Tax=Paraburkholderia unamae TaxID=219649 RepID=A0ABX5KP19_9BURK|nr:NAD-dependent epimerase/dehydratase family protein [Paraburkholderia unamae]PVX83968.1 NAD-dependent epimerase/dehydratase family protein [Paraburkholderia unamae]CAG9264991.1 Nucleoside-diphosphate-sugar epimerases [Paraburkholderia unamae]
MIATRNLRRARILIVGCGDVGLRCLAFLATRPDHARVFALARRPERDAVLRAAGAVPLRGDLDARASLRRLAGLADTVLHLAPPQKSGDDDLRTRGLIAALAARRRAAARPALAGMAVPARRPARHGMFGHAASPGRSAIVPERTWRSPGARHTRLTLVYASTTGVYGDCGGARIDETRTPQPANARAIRRVSAERQLRRATARGALRATVARIPGIYAANRLPLARLEKRTPALVERDDVYTSHIHADDLAAILLRMATHGRPARTIHASDDSELKMGEYFDRVADAFGLARAPRVSREAAERELDPVLLSFMRESRRLSNARLKRELRVRLRYADVDAFLRTLPPHP